jgi:SAM-dependent methyltransferase
MGAAAVTPIYDRIGAGYATTRRPDARIAAAVMEALGDAATVLNVGAGAGGYEPADREVVAVEPSAEMIRQRPPGAARCIQASAEALPFADASFDAVMAVLTIHHWSDRAAGFAEMRRVARRRVVVLTWDPAFAEAIWMTAEYLPEAVDLDRHRFPTPAELARLLPGLEVRAIPIPHDCTDGFYGAFWRRPEAYLDPQVRAGISVLAQLPPAVVDRGVAQLAADLRSGRWAERHAALLTAEALDLGYRLVVAPR